jgi:hypothetical protein
MKLCALVVSMAVVLVGCGGIPGMGGGGGGMVIAATSPYMNATDLTDYKTGNWVSYKTEAGGSSTTTTIKVVGEAGGNLWVQVGMSMTGMEYDHLLCVQPSDRKVVKAYFSGKDDKEWKKCDINTMPATTPTKECPGCKKEHKAPDMKWGDGNAKCGDKDLACKKCDATGWDCQGKEMKSTSMFSKDVPRLSGGPSEHGGLVSMEAAGMKMSLAGYGKDAKAKHDLPKE